MRKITTALLSLGVAAILVSPAHAISLMSEGFNYPDGPLVPNGGWALHSGSGTDIQVASGRAAGNMLNSPDDNRTFLAQGAAAKIYACFLVRIPTTAVVPDTNYIAHFKDTGTTNFLARVWVGAQGGTFSFALSASSCACNTNCVPVFWTGPLNYDQDYTVVTSYNGTTGVAEMWVDPLNESSLKVTAGGGPTTVNLSAFALRQSNATQTSCPAGSFAWNYQVDNLGVGTTFDDACTSGPTPATKATWGELKTIYR